MFHDIQDAYNHAVIAGDRRLAERYATIWLWLLRTKAEEDQETLHLFRSPANTRDLFDGIREADAGLFVEHELISAA